VRETEAGGEVRAEEQFKRGVEEFKKGNFWGAVENFKWATKLTPKSAQYWSYLSLAFSRMPGRLKDAEEALLAAVKLEPFNGDHYANLGLIYMKAGSKRRAHSNFAKALKIDPANEKAKKGFDQTKE
jgi:Flp pilus assembly protein TadD